MNWNHYKTGSSASTFSIPSSSKNQPTTTYFKIPSLDSDYHRLYCLFLECWSHQVVWSTNSILNIAANLSLTMSSSTSTCPPAKRKPPVITGTAGPAYLYNSTGSDSVLNTKAGCVHQWDAKSTLPDRHGTPWGWSMMHVLIIDVDFVGWTSSGTFQIEGILWRGWRKGPKMRNAARVTLVRQRRKLRKSLSYKAKNR